MWSLPDYTEIILRGVSTCCWYQTLQKTRCMFRARQCPPKRHSRCTFLHSEATTERLPSGLVASLFCPFHKNIHQNLLKSIPIPYGRAMIFYRIQHTYSGS